jgi:hypothetical protein
MEVATWSRNEAEVLERRSFLGVLYQFLSV